MAAKGAQLPGAELPEGLADHLGRGLAQQPQHLPVRPLVLELQPRAGTLEGPIEGTSCRPIRRTQEAGWLVLTCLTERFREPDAYRDRDVVSGYRFRGRVELATGAVAEETVFPLASWMATRTAGIVLPALVATGAWVKVSLRKRWFWSNACVTDGSRIHVTCRMAAASGVCTTNVWP